MQPWPISAGLTAAIAGPACLVGGARLEYFGAHWPVILAQHAVALALHAVLSVTSRPPSKPLPARPGLPTSGGAWASPNGPSGEEKETKTSPTRSARTKRGDWK